MKQLVQFVCWLALMSGVALYAQGQSGELPPSNLDPPPQTQQAAPPNERSPEEPIKEPKSSIYDLVDPSDPKFYAKLALLLGSILLARKAFRQMKSSQ